MVETTGLLVEKVGDSFLVIAEGDAEELEGICEVLKEMFVQLKVVQVDKNRFSESLDDIKKLNALISEVY